MRTPGNHAIVVGVDGSLSSLAALDWAVAEGVRRHVPLHLLCSREQDLPLDAMYLESPGVSAEFDDAVTARADDVLAEAAARVHDAEPSLLVSVETSGDFPAASLVELSEHADTVVIGHRGHSPLASALLGSVAQQVAAHAACPVVVVRAGFARSGVVGPAPRGVVVGVDGSAGAEQALGWAFEAASFRGVPLEVVHAWWTTVPRGLTQGVRDDLLAQQRLALSETVVGWAEKFPDVQVREHLVLGQSVASLVAQAAGAELLVVGNRGRGGFRRLLLGSVSHGVLQHAACPVVVVRPRG